MSNIPSHTRTRRTHSRSTSAGGSRRSHHHSGYLPAIESASEVYEQIVEQNGGGDQVVGGQIAPQAIFNPGQFAQTIRPVIVVGALPTLPDARFPEGSTVVLTTDGLLYRNFAGVWTAFAGTAAGGISPVAVLPTLPNPAYPIGGVVFYTVDGKLYRNVANAWTKAVDGGDLIANSVLTNAIGAGQVTAAKIAAHTITANEIAADTITAAEIAAGAISTSELAVGARLTGEVANEPGLTPGVFIDSTGILIRSGKLVLQDEFGLTTMYASGFDGSWADFVAFGLYNGAFTDGKVAAGSINTGRTADLPYWTLVTGGTGLYERQYDSLKPMLRCKWSGLGTAQFDSDKVPVYPKDFLELSWAYKINRSAGTLSVQPYIYWFKADGSASATAYTVCSGDSVTASTSLARGPADVVEVPADAALAMVKIQCIEAGTHNASNSIDFYSVSLIRKSTGIAPAERYPDSATKYVTPAAGTINDYNPGSIDTVSLYQVHATGNLVLTGLLAPSHSKRHLVIYNDHTTATILLLNNNTGSAAANRFSLPDGQAMWILPNAAVVLYYNDIDNLWHALTPGGGPAPNRIVYTANGTYTKSPGVHHVEVEVQGAGGGGGGAEDTAAGESSAGGGGGGGGYAKKLFTAADLAGDTTFDIVVGGGGAGGSSAGGNGVAGGDSSFAGTGITTVVGNGGGGGEGATASSSASTIVKNGGLGAGASGGDINITGGDGSNATFVGGGFFMQGHGGGSQLAGMLRPSGADAGAAGTTGHLYGGGGSGGYNAPSAAGGKVGGDGADGVVIVTEYFAP